MRLRIHIPFLITLLISGFLLSAVAYGVNRLQVYRQSHALYEQATRAEEQGDTDRAISLLRRYLEMRPTDGDVHQQLGILLKEQNAPRDAFFHLEAALQLNSANEVGLTSLVDVSLQLQRFSDALRQLNKLIELEPEQPEHRHKLAICRLELGHTQQAEAAFQRMIALPGSKPAQVLDYAYYLTRELKRSTEAERLLSVLIAEHPEDSDSHIAMGRWLLDESKNRNGLTLTARRELLRRALASAERGIELSDDSADAALLLFEVTSLLGKSSSTLPIILRSIERHPIVPQFYGAAAEIALAERGPAAAIEHLKDGLRAVPDNPDLMWNLAQLELEDRNLAAAMELVEKLRARRYPDPPLRFLTARILTLQGKWRAAANLLESSRASFDRSSDLAKQADLQLANCYRALGNSEQELTALRRVTQADPTWLPAREALAEALKRAGRYHEAAFEYENIVAQPDPAAESLLSLARLLMIIELQRGSRADWTRVNQLLDEAAASRPQAAAEVAPLRAEILVASGEHEPAADILQGALDAEPAKLALWQSLISLNIRLQQWDRAEGNLALAKSHLPDSSTLRLEEARLVAIRDGASSDRQRLRELANGDAFETMDERYELAKGMAYIYLALEDYPASLEQAELAVLTQDSATDEPLAMHMLLFELALRNNDRRQMSRWINEVKQVEGAGPLWRVGEAISCLVEATEKSSEEQQTLYQRAAEHLEEARVARPNWSRIASLQAEIFERQSQPRLAIAAYLEAIRLGEQNPESVARAVGLLYQAGRYAEAEQVVSKLHSQHGTLSSDLLRLATQVSLRLQNYERAVSWAMEAAERSQLAHDRVWLAQVYRIVNDYAQAEQTLWTAIEQDPNSVAAWNSLVQMFVQSDDTAAARRIIEEIPRRVDSEAERSLILAQCFQTLSDHRQAERFYRRAMELAPRDLRLMRHAAEFYLSLDKTDSALPLLENILREGNALTSLPSKATHRTIGDMSPVDLATNSLAWSRRNIALIKGLKTKEGDLSRPHALLDANQAMHGDTPEDLRIRAIILGERSDRKSMEQAAKLWEKVARLTATYSLEDNFLKALLCARLGDLAGHNRSMLELLANGGAEHPHFVRHYAQTLLEQGQADEAGLWLNRLERLAPNELSTLQLQVSLLSRLSNFTALANLFKRHGSNPHGDVRRWTADQAELHGLLAEQEGRAADAQKLLSIARGLYSELAQQPDQRQLLAGFLLRQGEIDGTLELLRSNSDWTPEQLTDVGHSALQTGRVSPDDVARLIDAMEAQGAQDEASLQLSLADLFAWAGDWQQAFARYQRVLSADPKQLAALNNMAMLLGLHGQRLDEALAATERAIALYGQQDSLLDTRGVVYLAQGDSLKAIADFSQALQSAQNGTRYFHLAQAQAKLGRVEAARTSIHKAIHLGTRADRLHPAERPAFDALIKRLQVQL
jgi:cellulose synthase operon protein C